MSRLWLPLLLLLVWSPVVVAAAPPPPSATLSADLPSGQPVGTTVTLTLSTDPGRAATYRLFVARPGLPARLLYDYGLQRRFEWTPLEEGDFLLIGTVRDEASGETTTALLPFNIQSRAGADGRVTMTDHPLVALYSAPPCPAGERLRVIYRPQGGLRWKQTPSAPCDGSRSINLYLAGMVGQQSHVAHHQRLAPNGTPIETSVGHPFTTGAPPHQIPTTVTGSQRSATEAVTLFSLTGGSGGVPTIPVAVDQRGRLIWYDETPLEPAFETGKAVLYRPVAGGTFLLVLETWGLAGQTLREIDLAGHVVRQTTRSAVSRQLVAQGQDPIGAFHHEARRLPSGHTAVIASVERLVEDVQGPGWVDVLGDMVVVLDENWQVVWSWNSFDHLDVGRRAVLDWRCFPNAPTCPPLFLAEEANDWTHANTVTYDPADGSLLISLRHQDWVIKVNYGEGAGDGSILWRLGPGGDFTLAGGSGFFPWFSHPHDPNLVGGNQIVIYDNGNTRCTLNPFGGPCLSRGQVYELDETAMTATLRMNASLDNYSVALGSAQPLADGGFHFGSGLSRAGGSAPHGVATEIAPEGTTAFVLEVAAPAYRSFRLANLYRSPGAGVPVAAP